MKKIIGAMALTAAFTVPMVMPATAADLDMTKSGAGAGCPAGSLGTYHFVNNQTGGATSGDLTAVFSSGGVVVHPSKVLSSVLHYDVPDIGGTLVSATTGGVPGKLVLSDYSCTEVKKKD